MPRIARVVAVGHPHHVTQRGNYRQDIFETNLDRQQYLLLVKSESRRYGLEILSYCLMSNHVHFVVVPKNENSLAAVFKYANMKYSQFFNKRKGHCGHLFQGRFFSSLLDEKHTIACSRYVERNPVRAGIVQKPWEWIFSSARVHCGLDKEDDLGVDVLFDYMGYSKNEWREYLASVEDLEQVMNIRAQTRRGRPLGAGIFVAKVEKKVGRQLSFGLRGRPKKQKSDKGRNK